MFTGNLVTETCLSLIIRALARNSAYPNRFPGADPYIRVLTRKICKPISGLPTPFFRAKISVMPLTILNLALAKNIGFHLTVIRISILPNADFRPKRCMIPKISGPSNFSREGPNYDELQFNQSTLPPNFNLIGQFSAKLADRGNVADGRIPFSNIGVKNLRADSGRPGAISSVAFDSRAISDFGLNCGYRFQPRTHVIPNLEIWSNCDPWTRITLAPQTFLGRGQIMMISKFDKRCRCQISTGSDQYSQTWLITRDFLPNFPRYWQFRVTRIPEGS